MSTKAPRGVRLVIALAGRRNAGKSSLINAITDQEIAIVSDTPGTTTDPVAKQYELLPLGPVTFYDTAGLDDIGELGELRIKATRKILWRSDVAVVVIGEEGITSYEKVIIDDIRKLDIPYILVFNKSDIRESSSEDLAYCREQNVYFLSTSAKTRTNIDELKQAIINIAPPELKREPVLAGDLFGEGDWVVCVVPIEGALHEA